MHTIHTCWSSLPNVSTLSLKSFRSLVGMMGVTGGAGGTCGSRSFMSCSSSHVKTLSGGFGDIACNSAPSTTAKQHPMCSGDKKVVVQAGAKGICNIIVIAGEQ